MAASPTGALDKKETQKDRGRELFTTTRCVSREGRCTFRDAWDAKRARVA